MAIINEILDSITGKQPNSNLTKASTTVNVGTYIEKTQENKTIMEQTIVKPIIEIERHGEYIICDLKFISAYDADLREIYNLIEMYGNNINNTVLEDYAIGEARIPTFVLMLTAINGIDNCITLSAPIFWALTSDKPGATPNMIRFLFHVDDVMFYGKGAGMLPTASAVVSDVVECARNMGRNISFAWSDEKAPLADFKDNERSFFVRIKQNAKDEAKEMFADAKEVEATAGEYAFVTAKMSEREFDDKIVKLSDVINIIRIEE